MTDSLLSGFRALDMTDERGYACGKILASLGVETIKVEKPGGDPGRHIPPVCGKGDHKTSLHWLAFNTDKRSITLNLRSERGRELFLALVRNVDFILESFAPGYLDELGLGYAVLSKVNPRIILTSITPFGQYGPYAHFKGGELIASAMSGVLATSGDPDRPPLKESPDLILYQASAGAALGTVIAHYARETSGQGQHVDTSIREVAASTRCSEQLVQWEFDKRLKERGDQRSGVHYTQMIWPCKDGYVFWSLFGGMLGASANRALSKWMDEDGMEHPLASVTDWEHFDMAAMHGRLAEFEDAIGRFFQRHTKEEIRVEGRERAINACVIDDPVDVLASPQHAARQYWTTLDYPEFAARLQYPRYFFLASETENYVQRRAPLAGQDNELIYVDELGLARSEVVRLKEAGVL